MNSTDSSTNVVSVDARRLYAAMRDAVAQSGVDDMAVFQPFLPALAQLLMR